MEIPVLLEPTPTGFRASTQSPVLLSGEGGTETAAIAALASALRQPLSGGGRIGTLIFSNDESVAEICGRMRSSPLHSELEQAFEDYRKEANAVEEAN